MPPSWIAMAKVLCIGVYATAITTCSVSWSTHTILAVGMRLFISTWKHWWLKCPKKCSFSLRRNGTIRRVWAIYADWLSETIFWFSFINAHFSCTFLHCRCHRLSNDSFYSINNLRRKKAFLASWKMFKSIIPNCIILLSPGLDYRGNHSTAVLSKKLLKINW